MPLIPIFIILFLALVATGIWFWRKLTSSSKIPLLQDLSISIPEHASYEFIGFDKLTEFQKSPVALHSLSHEMNILKDNQVKGIYLAHGTFVGNDPFQIISIFS